MDDPFNPMVKPKDRRFYNLIKIACLLLHLLRCIKGPIGTAIAPLMRLVDEPKSCTIFDQLISSAILRGNLTKKPPKNRIILLGVCQPEPDFLIIQRKIPVLKAIINR